MDRKETLAIFLHHTEINAQCISNNLRIKIVNAKNLVWWIEWSNLQNQTEIGYFLVPTASLVKIGDFST